MGMWHKLRAHFRPSAAERDLDGGVLFMIRPREVRGIAWVEDTARDLRVGLRSLGRSPGFAATTLLTLALGVGATTAVFTVVRGVLLRPLPFPEPDELTTVWLTNPRQGIDEDITSWPNFADWRTQGTSFEHMVAVRSGTLALTGAGDPEELVVGVVTDGFFDMLGAPLLLGRGFRSDEVEQQAQRVTVLSHELWTRRFGSDATVVGRTIQFGGEGWEVIGVTTPGRRYPAEAELWVPLNLESGPLAGLSEARSALWLPVMGRLADGVALESAQAEMSAVATRLAESYPDENQGMGITLEPLHETLVGDVRTPLLVLLGAIGFVLLVACANVANLLMVRGVARNREMAVRLSMGAGRGRLVRQVVAESALLGVLGGAAGVLIAVVGVRGLLAVAPGALPRTGEVSIDAPVLAFALALSLATAFLFGLLPAIQVGAADPGTQLREGARGSADGSFGKLRPAFVAGQFAVAVVLLVGAGLLVRSFLALQAVDSGFEPEGVLVARIAPPAQRYADAEALRSFHARLLPELEAIPGVEGAAVISTVLLGRLPNMGGVTLESRPELAESAERVNVTSDGLTPEAFRVLGMDRLAGRLPGPQDDAESTPVAVVNEAFVRAFLSDRDPLGERFVFGGPGEDPTWITIVGVVEDARRAGPDQDVRPAAFFPFDQFTSRVVDLLVRSSGDPAALAEPVRRTISRVDPDLPVRQLRTLESAMAEGLADRRFLTSLLAGFAAAGTLLAALGIYGVMAFVVGRRTREIGIRVALGAERGSILGSVLREAMGQAAVGLALGIAGAATLGGVLRAQLFGLEPTDPVTFAGACVALLAVALLASAIPAWRATRVDPTVALRSE
jgi:putative ABC transport system permease protein